MKLCFILIISIVNLSSRIYAQSVNINFERITTRQGLSHGSVNCIFQDSEGFLWFGTRDGLNRYDGHNFVVYTHDSNDSSSISNNHIRSICEDPSGDLWIGTRAGLNKFDKHTQSFLLYKNDPADKYSISDNNIQSVYIDHTGDLWVGTSKGLNKYHKKTNTFTLYEHNPTGERWTNNTINTIYEDKESNFWVGTTKGLSLFDKKTSTFKRFLHYTTPADSFSHQSSITAITEDRSGVLWLATGEGLKSFHTKSQSFTVYQQNNSVNSLNNNTILFLKIDSFGIIWLGTQFGGLNRYDPVTKKFSHYLHDAKDNTTLGDNTVTCIFEDRFKVLWVGGYTGGISKCDLLRKKISHFEYNPESSNSLRDNFVYSLYADRSGDIWIGNRVGLDKLDPKTGRFTHYSYDELPPKSKSDNTAHCIYEDSKGNIWVGLGGGGLKKFDKERKHFTSYINNPDDPNSLPHNLVNTIYEDKKGSLWISTYFGLAKFNAKTEAFITYKPAFVSTINYKVIKILEDSSGRLLLGTSHVGINTFDPQKGTFTQYNHNNLKGLTNIIVNAMYKDHSGNVWVSLGEGLQKLNTKTGAFTSITVPAELAKITIQGIMEDKQGNLWLSTTKDGIIKYTPSKATMRVYDIDDGLQSNEFNQAYCQSNTGEMYFGGNNGFNMLHPDSVRDNPYAPAVVINNFKVFDLPRSFSGKSITLPYSDNFFSFDFVALNYSLPEKNIYAFQLENFDKNWIQAGTRRYTSYTNLDPGEYIFRVIAANHDGVWSQESTSVKIIITPPFWKTPVAYLLYTLVLAAILYALWYYTISRERLKNNLKLKSIESQQLHELDQMRSQFFTNVSHEFRTPLTLIISPLEKLLSSKVDEKRRKDYYQLMHKNAKRLMQLINQLLDISKLEAGSMKLEDTPGDIIDFCKTHVSSFFSMAEYQGLKLSFSHTPDKIWTYFDQDKMEKIIYNLLSNAFKFTPGHGEIIVTISLKPLTDDMPSVKYLEIKVQDSGIGIAPEIIDKIFDRFYQVDSSHTREFEGTGIGLSLTRELVELHRGKISVTSEKDKGSCFIVELPVREVPILLPEMIHIESDDAFLEKENEKISHTLHTNTAQSISSDTIPAQQSQLTQQLPLLLVVEDNMDVRTYIRATFDDNYRILEAPDGVEGLKIAIELIPDLIISDLMMPKMDGIELCNRLKTDERTSHIPVILLTARTTIESKLEGLERGADDYITKPFHTDELIVRVKNLIIQRRNLRERFRRELILPAASILPASEEPTPIVISSTDEKFLQKVMHILEANLADPEFSIELLEKEIAMSHVQLYRKLKALTDQAPGEFVRDFRLKKAAQLLSQKQGYVSQIAYEVGFSNLSYFTKCFRQLYGMTPSEYAIHIHKYKIDHHS